MKPEVVIRHREKDETICSELLSQGIKPWLAEVLSSRIESSVTKEACLSPSLRNLEDPEKIPDMSLAVDRIVSAIVSDEKIVFAVDHDMDGQASAAVLWSAFVDHFKVSPDRLAVVTSHRLIDGYGITDAVVEKIIESDATLVISADKGSSDEPRIKRLAAAGRDVVVTDHHALPVEGPPVSAYACVNPTRKESQYDPYVCGAAVAFLTMAKVRSELLKQNYLADIPSLSLLVDYVAVATVADCVSLRPDLSYANRALVKKGIALINKRVRPCWEAFCDQMRDLEVSSQTIGFQLAPAVAAAGRLDWAEVGFRFLVAETVADATEHWNTLKQENEQRKTIEKNLREKAFEKADQLDGQSIVLYLEDGHSGVHGITASRLVERYGKPSAMFAPKGAGSRDEVGQVLDEKGRRLASGSFRSIPGLNIRDVLQSVHDKRPDLLAKFGGHEGAAGATVVVENIEAFSTEFEVAVNELLKGRELKPELWVDGDLPEDGLSLDSVDMLNQLDPWGRDFPLPIFCGGFIVTHHKKVGDGTHVKLQLEKNGQLIDAIWFNAIESNEPVPFQVGEQVLFVYKLDDNVFRHRRSLQLQIVAMV